MFLLASPRIAQSDRETPPLPGIRSMHFPEPSSGGCHPGKPEQQEAPSRFATAELVLPLSAIDLHLSAPRPPLCASESNPPSPLSKMPRQFCIHASFHLRGLDNFQIIVELQVMIPQQILPYQTEFSRFRQPPCQLHVQPRVGRNGLCRQSPGEISIRVPPNSAGNYHVRPDLCLMRGIGTLHVLHSRGVKARGLRMQLHLQERIPGADAPTVGYLP